MRRFPLAAIAGTLVLAVMPAMASAHRRHSHAHHFRARTEHFGGVTKADSSTTQPTTPTTPSVTVASLTNGVLTLTLADGSTVSGKVTDDTEVVCVSQAGAQSDDGEDNGGGAGERSGDGGGDRGGPGDDNGGGDDQGGRGDQGAPGCGLADLLPNAVVTAAELRFTSAGAEWERIELG